MARKLISGNDILEFNPSTGTIKFNGYVPLDKLLLINNTTRNINLFNFTDPGLPATATYNSLDNTSTIDVSYDTSSMNANDVIQVYFEKKEIEIKPSTTYKDPVSKFRVSNPQTLIDTDFEYSPQPTKWETLKLVNNIPTSYSSPFTENSILVDSITVTTGSNIMNIVPSNEVQLASGGVVDITGLTDPQFEGTFIVVSSNSTSFSVKLPFDSPKTATLNTIYSIVYKGAFYTGSLIQANDVETSTGAASTITVTTPNIHGFQEKTKLYLKNSRATKKYTFTEASVVPGSFNNISSTVSGLGGNGKTDYYSVPKIIPDDFVGFTEYPVSASGINFDNAGTNRIAKADLINNAAVTNINVGDVLIYYTPIGNDPIQDLIGSGTPTNQPIPNFKPLLVTSVTSNATNIDFKCKYASSAADTTFSIQGTNIFGKHRFIKGKRVIGQTNPNKIYLSSWTFDEFRVGDVVILNYGNINGNLDPNTTPVNLRNNLYHANYYGQTNSTYYIYQVSAINPSEKSLTLATTSSLGQFSSSVNPNFTNRTPTYYIDTPSENDTQLITCSRITRHPLANSIYFAQNYDDYQHLEYTNPTVSQRFPNFTNGYSYLVKKISVLEPNFYRIYENDASIFANNDSDTASNWNNPKEIYFTASGNGSAVNVSQLGNQTFTGTKTENNSDTISLPNRGGLENNSAIVYNTDTASEEIGGLSKNSSYRVKTEDVSLDSNSFRLSEDTGVTSVFGVAYTANQSTATFYVYDTIDRTSADLNADDGITSVGIVAGNTIQISGSDYANPVKKRFINNSFVVVSTALASSPSPATSVARFDQTLPNNFRRFIYAVTVTIPINGSINRETDISIYDNGSNAFAESALRNTKVTSIRKLTLNPPNTTGSHLLTQNIDGAIDDIYETKNVTSDTFEFETNIEIPEITKNINIGQSAVAAGPLTFTVQPGRVSITGNGTNSVTTNLSSITGTNRYQGGYANTPLSGNFAIEFNFKNASSFSRTLVAAGLFDSSKLAAVDAQATSGTGNIRTAAISTGGFYSYVFRNYYSTANNGYADSLGSANYQSSSTGTSIPTVLDDSVVWRIEYDDSNGTLSYSANGTVFQVTTCGSGLTFYPFFYIYDSSFYNGTDDGISNFVIASSDGAFTPGQEYLKIGSHNFADGTPVIYRSTSTNSADWLTPLVPGTEYYTRVLDRDFIGLSNTLNGALDRGASLIGISSEGTGGVGQSLETRSVNGFLTGSGTVAISTTSDIVNGTETNFLSDFSIGETFRIYRTASNVPGDYFESKIVSIKSDNVIKLETIPTFSSDGTNYFKQTGLFAVSDGKITHRPFDGGVAMNTGLIPNTKVIRQTRKYFRYQSGKGIQVSMAINFNPTNDIDTIAQVGTGSTTYYNIKSKFAHKLPTESVGSGQRVIISDVEGSSSSFFNRLSTDTGFPIVDVPDEFNFVVQLDSAPTSNQIFGFPKYSLKNWGDSALRAGLFDDQNGLFFEYDGTDLHAVRRSSTQQLSGRFQVQRNSYTIQGTDSSLTKQLSKNDSIVVRGQTYKVISVNSDISISVQPAYRGNSSNDIVISKVIDTKVPQSEWSLDRMDGTGESGYKIDISKIQMIYMDYSWYGAGSIRFGFKDQLGDVRYAHEFIHNNIFTESYFRSGNLPARYEVETFDNPLYSPALNHWGVSVIMDGRFDDDKAYLFTADSDALPFTNDGYSSSFNGTITEGSLFIENITTTSFDYSQLVIGETLVYGTNSSNTTPVQGILDPEAKIAAIEISGSVTSRFGSRPAYRIKMTKPALANATSSQRIFAYSGTAEDLQTLVPLVSIRLAPSIDNGNIGNLGFRDIINRMQLTLKTAGVLTTHDCEVQLILNGKLSDDNYQAVTSPSLSQIYTHEIGDRISEGIKVYSFRAQGGQLIAGTAPIGRRGLSSTDVSLEELALLGNSILGGDGTFPDGPDVLTLAVRPIDTSTINGASPFIISGKISWAEAQA